MIEHPISRSKTQKMFSSLKYFLRGKSYIYFTGFLTLPRTLTHLHIYPAGLNQTSGTKGINPFPIERFDYD